MNWFECKIKYEKTVEDGKIQKVNESYLVDALSFTEAEARIIEEMKPFISGEFEVANIRKVRVAEMFPNPNGDKWYRAKVMFVTMDEDKGVEKRTSNMMFVQAGNMSEALKGITQGMSTSMIDYEIASLTETSIMDVYKFEAGSAPKSKEEQLAESVNS